MVSRMPSPVSVINSRSIPRPDAARGGHSVLHGTQEVFVELHRLEVPGRGQQRLRMQALALLDGVDELRIPGGQLVPNTIRSHDSARRGSSRCARVSGRVSTG
jgi:hypothetical protein